VALDDSRARLSEQLNKYRNADELVTFVSAWYEDYKSWEARDTFDTAFKEGG
jgi:hypothetical protein